MTVVSGRLLVTVSCYALHAIADCGSILMASLYASMASSYLPKSSRASPLLIHASASCGSISVAVEVGDNDTLFTLSSMQPENSIIAAITNMHEMVLLVILFLTLTPYHFGEYVQPKPLLQIHNLLWNLCNHVTITHIDMIDLTILE